MMTRMGKLRLLDIGILICATSCIMACCKTSEAANEVVSVATKAEPSVEVPTRPTGLATGLLANVAEAGPRGTEDDAAAPVDPEVGKVAEIARKHSEGYAIVVFKKAHKLYLLKDGAVVKNERVLKSELDKRFFGFLNGTEDDEIVFDFPIPLALSVKGLGRRRVVADKFTPEGKYLVCEKNDRKSTGFTVALELAYPNLEDAKWGLANGKISKREFNKIKKKLRRGECPPYNTKLGGEIKIHGSGDKYIREREKNKEAFRRWMRSNTPHSRTTTAKDWTWGCIALENSAMFYLYHTVPVGTPVFILP